MTLKRRRIIFYSFVGLFVVITILISLYASGYTIAFRGLKNKYFLQKTSMLWLESEPAGATIYLNGQKQKTFYSKLLFQDQYFTTPTKIKNLTPGKYDISLELDGYWPWQKTIELASGQSQYFGTINLFKKDLPIKIMDAKVQDISLSPDGKFILLTTDNKIINLAKDQEVPLPEKEKLQNAQWLEGGKKLLANNLLLNLDNYQIQYLNNLVGEDVQKITCDQDGNKIFYITNQELNCFSLRNNKIDNLEIETGYNNYLVKNDYFLTITNQNKNSLLKIYSLKDKTILRNISLPLSNDYVLKNRGGKYIDLYSEKLKTLYILNPQNINPLITSISNIKTWRWFNDSNIIYSDGWAIKQLDISNDKNIIINRNFREINYIFIV